MPGLPATTQQQKDQQARVFEKVWSSVERIMGEMRMKLDMALKDTTRTVEDQERTIEQVPSYSGLDHPLIGGAGF